MAKRRDELTEEQQFLLDQLIEVVETAWSLEMEDVEGVFESVGEHGTGDGMRVDDPVEDILRAILDLRMAGAGAV